MLMPANGLAAHPGNMESVCVGSAQEIQTNGRKRVHVQGRDIVVIAHGGEFHALDSFCYHAGGPLHKGDIEDMGGNACIVCPWHRYKITLNAGHGLYMALDPFNDEKPPELKSKGAKQRTHTVTLKDGQVFVTLSPMDSELDSDRYNSVEYRQKFSLQ